MTQKLIFFFSIALILSNTAAASKIYKCQVNEKSVYQDTPCTEDFDYGLNGHETFDSWKYGMNIIAFKQEAKLRKLPVTPGNNSFSSSYNEQIINSKPNTRSYTYKSTIAGKHTAITLFFTQKTQKLYKVKAKFYLSQLATQEKQYFYKSLVQQLSNKYGTYIEARNYPAKTNILARHVLKDWVGTEKLWGSKADNLISLTGNNRLAAIYELTYKYLPLIKLNIDETTQEIQQTTDKALIRDKGKF